MLNLQHIHKAFSDKTVLNDVSLSVNPGEVIALIGENGAGKTTLLQIMLGIVTPDSGTVAYHHEVAGYVPQEAESVGQIQDAFKTAHEDWKVDYALGLVGLEHMSKDRNVSSLSGGQKTRLALAQVLASEPEPTVLLLDEPTNNLDAEGLDWLEQFIKSYSGAIVLVSHDRSFINKVATQIAELTGGTLKHYGGNYDFYQDQKAIEHATEQQRYDEYLSEKKRLEQAIVQQRDRNQHVHKHINKTRTDGDKYQRDFFRNRVTVKYGQNAKMMEGRLKQLEEVDRPEYIKGYAVNLQGTVHPNKLLVRLEDASVSYDRPIFESLKLELRGADTLHITGQNGSGKTTLLKTIAGLLPLDGGERQLGTDIHIGYFSQDIDGLDHKVTALANLQVTDAHMTDIYRQARSLGLDHTDLQKMPHELSRGQQAKLGFAKLLLGAHHLLILDEPTNHLDIPTKERIEAALQEYRGAMLFASHDRYFAKKMRPTKTLQISHGRLQ